MEVVLMELFSLSKRLVTSGNFLDNPSETEPGGIPDRYIGPPDVPHPANHEEWISESERIYRQEQQMLRDKPPPEVPPFWTKGYNIRRALAFMDLHWPYSQQGEHGPSQALQVRKELTDAYAKANSENLDELWPHLSPQARLVLMRLHAHYKSRY